MDGDHFEFDATCLDSGFYRKHEFACSVPSRCVALEIIFTQFGESTHRCDAMP